MSGWNHLLTMQPLCKKSLKGMTHHLKTLRRVWKRRTLISTRPNTTFRLMPIMIILRRQEVFESLNLLNYLINYGVIASTSDDARCRFSLWQHWYGFQFWASIENSRDSRLASGGLRRQGRNCLISKGYGESMVLVNYRHRCHWACKTIKAFQICSDMHHCRE